MYTFEQDGVKWTEVYATDSNLLGTSSISLGDVPAAKVRMVMKEVLDRFASSTLLIRIADWWLACCVLGEHGRDGLRHFIGNALANNLANLPVKSRSVNSVPCAVLLQAAGAFMGRAVYGIRTLAVLAPGLRSIVEDCALAAKSTDARLHDNPSPLNAPLSLALPVIFCKGGLSCSSRVDERDGGRMRRRRTIHY